MRNEQRLFLQLVVGMVVAMCQGSVFCFSLFGNTLKSPPFNYNESQLNIVSGVAAIASFLSMPYGLLYDYCGQRITFIFAFFLVGGGWILIYFFVFKPAEDFLLMNNNNNSTNSTTDDDSSNQLPSLALVTGLFSLVFSAATSLEMAVMFSNLAAFEFFHGWLVVVLKSFIGLGSTAIALTQAAFFVTNDSTEKSKLAGQFCLYLGFYSAFVSLLGAIFTSHPFSPDYENEILQQENNKNNSTTALNNEDQQQQEAPLLHNNNEKKENEKHHSYVSIFSKMWDIRVIGINVQPPKLVSSSSSPTTNSPYYPNNDEQEQDHESSLLKSRHDYHSKYKPAMSRALWLLLLSLILVIAGNSIELGLSTEMPQWSFMLIAMIVMALPLMFLSLLGLLPGIDFPTSASASGSPSSSVKRIFDFGKHAKESSLTSLSPSETPSAKEDLYGSTKNNNKANELYSPKEGENNINNNHNINNDDDNSLLHNLSSSFLLLVDLEGETKLDQFHHHQKHRIEKLSPIQNKLRIQGTEALQTPLMASSSSTTISPNNNNNNDNNQNLNHEDFKSAIQYFSEALSLSTEENKSATHPNNALLYSNRSAAYCGLARNTSESKKENNNSNEENLQSALADAVSCIQSDKNWWRGYWRKGIALEQLKMFSDAYVEYQNALQYLLEGERLFEKEKDKLESIRQNIRNAIGRVSEEKRKVKEENKKNNEHQQQQKQNDGDRYEEEDDEYAYATRSNNKFNPLWHYKYETEDEKPFRIKIVEKLETMFLSGQPLRHMTLLDLEDDYDEEPPQNDRKVWSNLFHHPLEFIAMWLMFGLLWGSTVAIYSNVYSIYYSLQGGFLFTSARNAVFVSIFGVGNSCGRILAGLCVPGIVQARSRKIWILLRVSPVLNIFGMMLFLVSAGAALAIPFLMTALATGFTWGSTIIFVKRVFKFPAMHYAFFYTAGCAGIVFFNIFLFSTVYDNEAAKQEQQRQQQQANSNASTTPSPSTTSNDANLKHHCLGIECLELTLWLMILANFLAYLCAEFVIYRLDRGSLDSALSGKENIKEKADDETVILKQNGRNAGYDFRDQHVDGDSEDYYDHDEATAAAARVTPRASEQNSSNKKQKQQQLQLGGAEGGHYANFGRQEPEI